MGWLYARNTNFSVKSAYRLANRWGEETVWERMEDNMEDEGPTESKGALLGHGSWKARNEQGKVA